MYTINNLSSEVIDREFDRFFILVDDKKFNKFRSFLSENGLEYYISNKNRYYKIRITDSDGELTVFGKIIVTDFDYFGKDSEYDVFINPKWGMNFFLKYKYKNNKIMYSFEKEINDRDSIIAKKFIKLLNNLFSNFIISSKILESYSNNIKNNFNKQIEMCI